MKTARSKFLPCNSLMIARLPLLTEAELEKL
jgi:hypothetical protein